MGVKSCYKCSGNNFNTKRKKLHIAFINENNLMFPDKPQVGI